MVAAGWTWRVAAGGRNVGAALWLAALGMSAAMVGHAAVPDAARESRWAQEIVPQIVVGDAVWLATPSRAKVLGLHAAPSGKAKAAVILVHGLGVHPDFGMIGSLRTALPDHGYETLSVQMPVLAADAPREDYRDLHAVAGERIDAAIAWVRARGASRVVIVSHSAGSAMTAASIADRADGWVAIGMTVDFPAAPRIPFLDVVAERDLPEALAATAKRATRMPKDRCTRRMTVPGADHYFESASAALIAAILPFLEQVAAGNC